MHMLTHTHLCVYDGVFSCFLMASCCNMAEVDVADLLNAPSSAEVIN